MSYPALVEAALSDSGESVTLRWSDGTAARFHAIWLRDNAQDPETCDPGNGQRRITILDLAADMRLADVAVTAAGGLRAVFHPDGHRTEFDSDWLRVRIYDRERDQEPGLIAAGVEPWGCVLGNTLPSNSYTAVRSRPEALAEWLNAVRRYGFAVMTGTPMTDGAVTDIVSLFGYVRETNYGRHFDVRSEIAPSNLAYTGLSLQVHTDNPYRHPAPTLQVLQCLSSDAEGGDSIVVDGFHAAKILADENPGCFELLSRYDAPFAYRGKGTTDLQASAPMIDVSPGGKLRCVRFNNRSAAPFNLPYAEMRRYYDAYRRFAEILARPELQVTFRLDPGDLFIVDNERVLHGRKGFSGTGTRHLQGCYADKDSLYATLRILNARLREAAA